MIKMEQQKNIIEEGQAILGLELGSTRIKAVLIGKKRRNSGNWWI